MPRISIEFKGLRELQRLEGLETSTRLISQVRKNIGTHALKLHGELKFSIIKAYNSPYNLNTAFSEFSSSTKTVGKNVIQNDMNYRYSFRDLSKYFDHKFLGNINPSAKRQGWVHVVHVKRGQKKISYGKQGRGGFIPTKKGSTGAKIFGKFGAQMFERKGRARYPLRLLLGPHLKHMIRNSRINDSKVKKLLANMEKEIFQNIELFKK